ncbi:MAG: SBBP repeat-containing protein [Acidobacteriota bacterium]
MGFDIGKYDSSLPLTIDPVLSFSSLLGWAQSDAIAGIAQDDAGDIFLAGVTSSINLPASGGFQMEKSGGTDVFVAKLAASDRSIQWITYFGGSGDDDPSNIELDSSGNIYVVGTTSSGDLPVKNAFQESRSSSSDAFLLKLNPTGSSIIFSTYLGGKGADSGYAGGADVFVTRLSSDGTELVFSTFFGGSRDETPAGLILDSDGSILLDGRTTSTNLPLVDAVDSNRSGGSDAFLCKINSDASELVFSSYLGGGADETVYCLAKDALGQIYVGGETSSSDLTLVDPIQSAYAGNTDAFVLRIAADLSSISAATYFGGAGADSLRQCQVDGSGRLVGIGVTTSPDMPLAGALDSSIDGVDAFVAIFDFDRSQLAYSSYFGGDGTEIPSIASVTPDDRVLMAGVTTSQQFPKVHALQEGPGGSGLFRTSNGGSTWQSSGSGLKDPNVISLFVDPANSWLYAGTVSGGIYVSKDLGVSWTSIGLEGQRVLSIAADPTDHQVVFAGTLGGLQRTENGGQDWTLLSDGDHLAVAPITAIAIDPSNAQVVYAGTQGSGIFKSTSAGDEGSWGPRNTGLNQTAGGKTVFTIRIDAHDSDNVYLGTGDAVYRSTTGGSTWALTSFQSVGNVLGLAIDPGNSSVLYAASQVAGLPIIARTQDGGTTWEAQPMQPSSGTVSSLWISPSSSSTFFAGTYDNGVLKGTNTGQSWQPTWQSLGSSLKTTEVMALAIDRRHNGQMYVGYQSGSDGFVAEMQPQNVFYFPQIADGIAGRIKFTTAMVFVNTGDATTVQVDFFDSSGSPLDMRFDDGEASSELQIPLAKGGGTYLQSPADPGLRVGYARITAGPGVGGTAIFNRTDVVPGHLPDSNVTQYEAGVPATRAAGDFVFLLDSLGDNDTGLALVNAAQGLPGEEDPAQIDLTLRDSDGYHVGDSSLDLARGRHTARFINQLFSQVKDQASEMRGIVSVHSPVPLVALTLRQRDNPGLEFPYEVASLTPFPVMQPSNLGRTLYFPQIADGVFGLTGDQQFRTSFFLANPGTLGIITNITLSFFDSKGAPMGLDLGTGGLVGSVSLQLGSGQFYVFQTPGTGPQQIGYAVLTASNPVVAGTAVFTQRLVGQAEGQNLYEAGVAATLARRKFSIFVDSIGASDTGLALVNANDGEATITLRLYDLDFNLLAEKEISLAAGQHLPRFINQLFDGDVATQAKEMRGVLTVESDLPIAAVTLRQKDAQYPDNVPTLTTFPVIAGVPEP